MLGILADCLTLLDTNSGGSGGSSGGTTTSSSLNPSSGVKRLPNKHITTGYHSPPVLDAQAVANILLGRYHGHRLYNHMIILIVVMVMIVVVMVAIAVTHVLIIFKLVLLPTYYTLTFKLLHIIHF